jgi:hypothetical protein
VLVVEVLVDVGPLLVSDEPDVIVLEEGVDRTTAWVMRTPT